MQYRGAICTPKKNVIQLIATLLIIGGIETNPGPNFNGKCINFGLLNAHSVGHNAAIVHDVISDNKFDVLALTETWVPSDAPNAVKLDIRTVICLI